MKEEEEIDDSPPPNKPHFFQLNRLKQCKCEYFSDSFSKTEPNSYAAPAQSKSVDLDFKSSKKFSLKTGTSKIIYTEAFDFETVKQTNKYTTTKKKLMKSSTLFNSFMIANEASNIEKLKLILLKLLPVNICAVLITIIFIYSQNFLNKICRLDDKCDCSFPIKVVEYLRDVGFYWNFVIYIAYYCIFTLKLMKRKKIKKILFWVTFEILLLVVHFNPDQNLRYSSLLVHGLGNCINLSAFFICYQDLNISILQIIKKYWQTFSLIIILEGNLIISLIVLGNLKENLEKIFPNQGANFYQLFLLLFLKFTIFLIKEFILCFDEFRRNQGIKNFNSIVFFLRFMIICVCGLEFSNMLESDLSQWGGMVALFSFINTRIKLYMSLDPIQAFFKKVLRFLTGKEWFILKKHEEYMNRVISGIVLEAHFIMMSRLIVLFSIGKWIINHRDLYSNDCALTMDKFIFKGDMFIMILFLNILIPVCFIAYMILRDNFSMIYQTEKMNFVQRTYIIVLFHYFLEVVLQDQRYLYQ